MDQSGYTQKDISIIIVSYNAKAFLKLCLYSVNKSAQGISSEIIIVDNASSDGTIDMIRSNFQDVHLIANTQNVGFSAANNQAIHKASGKIILLLNPDTIIGENTFREIIQFYHERPKAAAVGVKMIDGSGRYLRESKRGLPTPRTSLFKLTGLAKLFPKSRRYAKYYQGHLNENEAQQSDILSGAFMAFRKDLLKKTHAFDESFFMYGEDIDLSYRLSQQGDENYYIGTLPIIHFKGESTPMNTKLAYHFYHSMWIFYQLHFKHAFSALTALFVKAGIYFATGISVINLPFRKLRHLIQQKNLKRYQTILFCSTSESIYTEIEIQKLYPATFNVQFIHPDDLNETLSVQLSKKTMVIFDLANLNIAQMIRFIEKKADHAFFSFLSPDQSFILCSQNSYGKGQLTQIHSNALA